MVDLQWLVFAAISFPAEAILHSNYLLLFGILIALTYYFISALAAFLALLASLLAILSSFGQRPCPLPRYRGSLDVLLGRSHRASTDVPSMVANNNVSLASFSNKLVIAYRKADSHFASPLAQIVVASTTASNLEEWTEIWNYRTGQDDLREVLLFSLNGTLFLYFACLAPDKRGFTPRRMQWTSTNDLCSWSPPVPVGRVSEITWDVKVLESSSGAGKTIAYKTSYVGNHYAADAVCDVHFECSSDGKNWGPVGKDSSVVYVGGVSEVSFDFTTRGDLVAIGRNEDGDATGFGSQFFFAAKGDLGSWTALKFSLPYRFDSPRLLLMDGELLLFARYASTPYNVVPQWMPFGLQRFGNILTYSLLPKSAAVYRICAPSNNGVFPKEPVELIRFFEATYGDTGFFSLAHDAATGDFVIANYSSSCHSSAPWIYGQVKNTDVYVCRGQLVRREDKVHTK